jgi:hypothetical protein
MELADANLPQCCPRTEVDTENKLIAQKLETTGFEKYEQDGN